MLKRLLKPVARLALGDYAIYYIYRCTHAGSGSPSASFVEEPDVARIGSSDDEAISAQAGYAGHESRCFAVSDAGRLLAVCFYWYGDRYRKRGFWPLGEGEAKLVQVVTAPRARGQRVARELIAESARRMLLSGFHTLYARIWHSNTPSIRAFERAGWERIAAVFEVNPLRLRRPWRLRVSLAKAGGT